MVIAMCDDGSLILGLTRENVERLIGGEPINITNPTHGPCLPPTMPLIGIVFGETAEQITETLKKAEAKAH